MFPAARLRSPRFLLCLLALASATATVVAATVERASLWREHEIVIDGHDDDWKDAVMPVKGQRFSLGVVNDGDYLYLCLPTKDPTVRGFIVRRGLVVWIDKQGGKKEQFGIHFPIAMLTDRRPAPPGDKPGGEREAPDPFGAQGQVGILGPGRFKTKLVPLEHAGGIEARVGLQDDLLVYELKVPLKEGEAHPYAPDVKPGDMLRVVLETPAIPGGRAPLGHGPGGVPIYGGGSAAPGGVGIQIGVGGPPIGSPDMLEPLEVPLKVKLATSPTR